MRALFQPELANSRCWPGAAGLLWTVEAQVQAAAGGGAVDLPTEFTWAYSHQLC
jgi:hypothetical protein